MMMIIFDILEELKESLKSTYTIFFSLRLYSKKENFRCDTQFRIISRVVENNNIIYIYFETEL